MCFSPLSKIFFGTESSKECSDLFEVLKESNIRCTGKTLYGKSILKCYTNDPFHVYARSYLQKLKEFHIIRVNRLDYKKAIEIYNNDFD